MAEGLVTRVKRLVSGGVNQLVDTIENTSPDTVMSEAVREIDRAVDQVRDELASVLANKHLANRRLGETTSRHEELQGQIALAVKEGRDDLAEAAIARQLDLEVQIPVLESAVADASREEKELEGYIGALQARKREMEAELETYRKARQQSATDSAAAGVAAPKDTVEGKARKAEEAFERVMKTATGLPGGLATDKASASKMAELEDLARKNRISERLATLKAAAKDG
ncbi:PspA/IM30 family protein [Roseibium aggregatum]|uniref:PspA/IM30 family protein n=1 Tax=Roseibium aggregatum TaxID=187304 RepID=A0A939J2L7_9HYPH|nr:PspA/IM30 family protein [Roseibium aggregatum]MBN9669672.1 PspA/IM30 family protein [Roseibium aggregatum]